MSAFRHEAMLAKSSTRMCVLSFKTVPTYRGVESHCAQAYYEVYVAWHVDSALYLCTGTDLGARCRG